MPVRVGEAESLACRRCGEQLAESRAERSPVTYYRCNCCGTTVSSADASALRAVARALEASETGAEERASEAEFREWQRRMNAFAAHADQTDPFKRLGLPPDATLGEARERFHALAMAQHPDRGGDAAALSEIVDAFDRIRDRFTERLRREQSASAARSPGALRPRGASILPRRRPESWSRWAAQSETALAKRRP
jgi:hypothetical protein